MSALDENVLRYLERKSKKYAIDPNSISFQGSVLAVGGSIERPMSDVDNSHEQNFEIYITLRPSIEYRYVVFAKHISDDRNVLFLVKPDIPEDEILGKHILFRFIDPYS
jgi:hypothetical protein